MCIVYSAYAPNNWCIIFKYCLFNGAIICLILICSVRNCYGSFNRYVCIVIINHLNLLNYVPYAHPVLGASCPTCLILYMLSFSMCLMPFVPRVLRALVPHVASCRLCSCVSRASCSTCRPRRPVRPPGMGVKNMGNRQIRLRRYKIKRFLAQPKNVEVKQNGRVVGRIVVRRSTVYPGTRRRNYY